MHTPAIVRTPAPEVVLEAPESVALLLYSANAVGDAGLASVVMSALESTAAAAAGRLGRHFAVRGTEPHLAVQQDQTFPRPHAHVLVRDRVERSMFDGWARYAHARYRPSCRCGCTTEGSASHGSTRARTAGRSPRPFRSWASSRGFGAEPRRGSCTR
ncbi:hypothetical protein [Amycolatopsis thermophila]|uniref:Uncharacterized protein n=1 Tax=Amycolatopsis thermophila TaxID=206084 RepID=A0ABU0F7B0_9PSEU|nr:hypothetical protein [Amycolatopsis thermophila]MDQ0382897.1 hypothetical protein [Amycolatopsis thermophila]